MTKRSHGEGTTYYREDRGRWVAEVSYLDSRGKRRRRRRMRKTKAEANRERRKLLAQLEQGMDGGAVTVEALLERWLEHKSRRHWKKSTEARTRSLVARHLVAELGHLKLEALRVEQVQALLDRRLEDGLELRTVDYIRVVLRAAIEQARRWRLVTENVATLVELPARERQRIEPLTDPQARRFLSGIVGDPLEALYLVAITVALRQGELIALQWDDVDLDDGLIHVRRNAQRVRGETIVDTPKSDAGVRTIALPGQVLAEIRAHRRRQAEQRLRHPAWIEHDLVFPNDDGDYLIGSTLTKTFQRLIASLGIAEERAARSLPRVRFHDLRHTAVALMLAEGVPLEAIQKTLGHADFALTMNVYGHLLERTRRDVADRMGAFLERGS